MVSREAAVRRIAARRVHPGNRQSVRVAAAAVRLAAAVDAGAGDGWAHWLGVVLSNLRCCGPTERRLDGIRASLAERMARGAEAYAEARKDDQ